MKTPEQYLEDYNITKDTRHHNYDYFYKSALKAIKKAQIDAYKEIIENIENLATQIYNI